MSEAPPTPAPAPLGRGEVREIQTLLLRFGFDPGPVDGAAGRLTEAAVSKYQEARALPQTGKPDRALLDQLREDPASKVDPAPQVAQRPSWKEPGYREPAYKEPAHVAPAPPRQGSNFLGFLRNADNNLSRWLNSLGH
jgi:peptidoglycan hydrolase-like protein with peptidoglycan-binding domain